jgi:hypothetical protein
MHADFDGNDWLLLPDLSTLQDVKHFVKSVLAARQNSSSKIEDFKSKVS